MVFLILARMATSQFEIHSLFLSMFQNILISSSSYYDPIDSEFYFKVVLGFLERGRVCYTGLMINEVLGS